MVSGGLLKFGRLNRFPSKYMFERARVSSLSFSSTAFTLKAKLLESFPRSLSPSIKTLALGLDINTHSIGFSVADPDLGLICKSSYLIVLLIVFFAGCPPFFLQRHGHRVGLLRAQ